MEVQKIIVEQIGNRIPTDALFIHTHEVHDLMSLKNNITLLNGDSKDIRMHKEHFSDDFGRMLKVAFYNDILYIKRPANHLLEHFFPSEGSA